MPRDEHAFDVETSWTHRVAHVGDLIVRSTGYDERIWIMTGLRTAVMVHADGKVEEASILGGSYNCLNITRRDT